MTFAIQRAEAWVDGSGPHPCELRINQESHTEWSLGPRPDTNWSMTDAAGHFHAYDQSPAQRDKYPTLKSRSRHIDCDGSCAGVCGGEGYDQTYYECRLCAATVEPGLIYGEHSTTFPGLRSWSAVVTAGTMAGLRFQRPASLRVRTNGGGESFGIGEGTEFVVSADGMEITYVGHGPLGWRKVEPVAAVPPPLAASPSPG